MLKRLFGKKEELKKHAVRVVLPEEEYEVLEWQEEDLPYVAVLNSALKDFEPKRIFSWHLSVIIDFDDLVENGMPSQEERAIVDPFCDKCDEEIKAGGNALFLVRATWNKTRRLVWRVYDPHIAHEHLQYIVEHRGHPRPLDWHMEQAMGWEQAKWYFEQIKHNGLESHVPPNRADTVEPVRHPAVTRTPHTRRRSPARSFPRSPTRTGRGFGRCTIRRNFAATGRSTSPSRVRWTGPKA